MATRVLELLSFAHHKQVAARILRPWVIDRHRLLRVHAAIEEAVEEEAALETFHFRGLAREDGGKRL